jgi:hypothetical protein
MMVIARPYDWLAGWRHVRSDPRQRQSMDDDFLWAEPGNGGLVKPTELPLGACLLGLALPDLKGKGDAIAASI